jgi:hypothetical protein
MALAYRRPSFNSYEMITNHLTHTRHFYKSVLTSASPTYLSSSRQHIQDPQRGSNIEARTPTDLVKTFICHYSHKQCCHPLVKPQLSQAQPKASQTPGINLGESNAIPVVSSTVRMYAPAPKRNCSDPNALMKIHIYVHLLHNSQSTFHMFKRRDRAVKRCLYCCICC